MAASAAERGSKAWSDIAQKNAVAGFVDTLLRGTGQVMFQNNPLTGLLFLIGIFYNSRLLGVAALIGLVSSTATAMILRVDQLLIRAGLFGFNGILVGIGLAFFLEFAPYLIVYMVVGAAVSTVVMAALANLLGPWDMPALTAPFVLTTWILLFALYQLEVIRPTELIAPAIPDPAAQIQTLLRPLPEGTAGGGLSVVNLAHAFFRGIGEVMFEDNLVTGLIFLVAILINSRIAAAMAAMGSAVGAVVALLLGADGSFTYHGLYGFNPVLCAIAICGTFFVATWKSALYALLAVATGTVAFASISVLLAPIGMPALTAPFVLVTWLFLLPKAAFAVLRPVALADVTSPENIRKRFLGARSERPQSA
jgi:urea transporter